MPAKLRRPASPQQSHRAIAAQHAPPPTCILCERYSCWSDEGRLSVSTVTHLGVTAQLIQDARFGRVASPMVCHSAARSITHASKAQNNRARVSSATDKTAMRPAVACTEARQPVTREHPASSTASVRCGSSPGAIVNDDNLLLRHGVSSGNSARRANANQALVLKRGDSVRTKQCPRAKGTDSNQSQDSSNGI